MATFGWQPAFTSYQWTGWNNDNQVASGVVNMPQSGTVTAITFYCGGANGATTTAAGVIWDNAGNVLTNTAPIAVAAGSMSTGGQAWYSGALSYHMNVGTAFRMGWWRNPSQATPCVWSYGTGTSYVGTAANTSGPAPFAVDGTTGQIGVYITYTPDAAPPPPTVTTRTDDNRLLMLMRQRLIPSGTRQ